jgi:hypothetical protein
LGPESVLTSCPRGDTMDIKKLEKQFSGETHLVVMLFAFLRESENRGGTSTSCLTVDIRPVKRLIHALRTKGHLSKNPAK